MKRRFLNAAAAMLLACAISSVTAQTYPAKTVRGIVSFGVGGQTDAAARILAQKLSERWGQPFVIENRVGANGNVGTEAAVKSPADGYSLLVTTQTLTLNRVLFASPAFDPLRDLAPISLIGVSDFVLVVHPSVPAQTVSELISYVKANPQKLVYGATSFQGEFIMELFNNLAGIRIERIPYTAMANLQADLVAGRVTTLFTPPRAVIGHIQAGKLRALAVSGGKPMPMLPNVPSIKPVLPDLNATTWYAVLAPSKTPADVIGKLNAEFKWAIDQPDVRQRLEQVGIDAGHSSPEELRDLLRKDVDMIEDLVRRGVMKVSG
ncbi:MAG: tripartite tricarboxylate transporter substrate binding protein [Betaproteobacteria bacterium]|nr:tripartite tricarboxylate transporter substrate binding protein [Betaproteobacteria bacterium]